VAILLLMLLLPLMLVVLIDGSSRSTRDEIA